MFTSVAVLEAWGDSATLPTRRCAPKRLSPLSFNTLRGGGPCGTRKLRYRTGSSVADCLLCSVCIYCPFGHSEPPVTLLISTSASFILFVIL